MNNLHKFIQENRERLKMSKTELSEKSGVSRSIIWELETMPEREENITLRVFTKILMALGYRVTIETQQEHDLRLWNRKYACNKHKFNNRRM